MPNTESAAVCPTASDDPEVRLRRADEESSLLRDDIRQMQGQMDRLALLVRLGQAGHDAAKSRNALDRERALARENVLGAALLQRCADAEARAVEIEALRRENERLTAELADANRELARIHASRSWRVMAVLRKIRHPSGSGRA